MAPLHAHLSQGKRLGPGAHEGNSPCSTKAHGSSLSELIYLFLVKHKKVQSHDFKLDSDRL